MKARIVVIFALTAAIVLAACDRATTEPPGSRGATGHGPRIDSPRPTGGPPGTGTPPSALFPLVLSQDRRYLADVQGRPFLIQGDTAWSIVAELSREDARRYLDDRARRGFNAILFNVVEPAFTHHSPPWANAEGDEPFRDEDDWTTVNEAYFAHVDWVLGELEKRRMLALAVPAYIGYDCGDQGWCEHMFANGVERLESFGRFIGARYKDVPNIIWIQGGDLTPSTSGDPSQMDLVNAVASGIAAGDDGTHYHAAHWGRGTSGADLPGSSWIDIDTTYPAFDRPVYDEVLEDTARDEGVMPVLMLEASYENEHHTSVQRLRAQMYQPVLSGACGFVFGNFPIWAFWDPGDPAWTADDGGFPEGWQTALGSAGSESARIAGEFFQSLPWHQLQPDRDRSIVVAGGGAFGNESYALGASTPDRHKVVIHFSAPRSVSIDMGALPGRVRARFFDPSLGTFTELDGSPFSNDGVREIVPPRGNGDGSDDWLLLLEAT